MNKHYSKSALSLDQLKEVKALLGREPSGAELVLGWILLRESFARQLLSLETHTTGEETRPFVEEASLVIKIRTQHSADDPFTSSANAMKGAIQAVYAAGARPIASAVSIQVGPREELSSSGPELPTAEGQRPAPAAEDASLDAMCAGVASISEGYGVTIIGREVRHDLAYAEDPLVVAFCFGLRPWDCKAGERIGSAGQDVFCVSATAPTEPSAASAPSPGNPNDSNESAATKSEADNLVRDKLLCEACREGVVCGMVAAGEPLADSGLAEAICRIVLQTGAGLEIDLSKIQVPKPDLDPERLLSNPADRDWLIIASKERQQEVDSFFAERGFHCIPAGTLEQNDRIIIRQHDHLVAEVPLTMLTGPKMGRQTEAQQSPQAGAPRGFYLEQLPDMPEASEALKKLLAAQRSVCRQYAHGSAGQRLARAGFGAMPLPGENPGSTSATESVALAFGGNSRSGSPDPGQAGKQALIQAARNLACAGATPRAVALHLCFPQPETLGFGAQTVQGTTEACREFNSPSVTLATTLLGPASQSPCDRPPIVATIGLVTALAHLPAPWFKDAGDIIILLGPLVEPNEPLQGLSGSAYLQEIHGLFTTPPPWDYEQEKETSLALRALVQSGILKSARACGEGGVAMALAQSCFAESGEAESPRLVGAHLEFPSAAPSQPGEEGEPVAKVNVPRLDSILFSESQARFVVSTGPLDAIKVLERARLLEVPATRLGTVGGDALELKHGTTNVSITVVELYEAWRSGQRVGGRPQESRPAKAQE